MTTTPNELRAAADKTQLAIERVRRVENGESLQAVYGLDRSRQALDDAVAFLNLDYRTLARAIISTIPPDGDEPISEERLREIGWTRVQLRLEMVVDGRTIELYDCVIADSPMRGLLVIFFKKNTKSIYNSLAVADNCIYHSSIAVNVTATTTKTRVIPQRGMKMTTRQEAAESINGTIEGEFVVYFNDATQASYRNPVSDLDYLAELRDSDDADIRRDAYSHWCSGTSGEEIVTTICGKTIKHDASGQGHSWKAIGREDIPSRIIEEIEGEIIDGQQDTCDDYIASNGQHYRW